MIQRIALLAGGLGAAAVLAFALGLTNFVFAGPSASKQTADTQPVAQVADSSVASADTQSNGAANQGAQTKKVVDKVYIAPTPAPKVVRVKPETPATPKQPPAAAPTQPKPPAAPPAWHDDGNGSNDGQESEHSGGHRGHEGDD